MLKQNKNYFFDALESGLANGEGEGEGEGGVVRYKAASSPAPRAPAEVFGKAVYTEEGEGGGGAAIRSLGGGWKAPPGKKVREGEEAYGVATFYSGEERGGRVQGDRPILSVLRCGEVQCSVR